MMLDLFQKPRIHKLCSVMQYNLFHLSNLEVRKMLFILHCHTQQHFTVWKSKFFSSIRFFVKLIYSNITKNPK